MNLLSIPSHINFTPQLQYNLSLHFLMAMCQYCPLTKADHPRMGVLLVTWQRRHSHHSIRHSWKPHDACKFHGSIFYRMDLLPIGVLHCGNRKFRVFCCCNLDVDPVTFIYEPVTYPLTIYSQTKNELSMSRLSQVLVLHTDKQTDRQTDRCHRNYYYAAFRVFIIIINNKVTFQHRHMHAVARRVSDWCVYCKRLLQRRYLEARWLRDLEHKTIWSKLQLRIWYLCRV